MRQGEAASHGRSVTVHSSWHGILLAHAGGAVLAAAGLASIATAGWHPVSAAVATMGSALLVVVLVDYPIATRFDASGIHRRAPLRTGTLRWDRIDRFSRTRPSRRWLLASAGARGALRPGGLVAVVGWRRYLLVDQCESRPEHDELRALVQTVSPALADTLDPPPDGVPPTWLHRRRRWVPRGDRG